MIFEEKYIGTKYIDWYYILLLLLIGIFSILVSLNSIPMDLGIGALILLFIIMFASLEELMPSHREVRRRKQHPKKRK